jgi:hypothetical protein
MILPDILAHLQHPDLPSLLLGALGVKALEAAAARALTPLPALAVRRLRARVEQLAASGKIDAPTLRLLKRLGKAVFSWADEELPDKPGPEKMAAVLDRLAAIPYLGALVRADRPGVQAVLQAAYDAVKAEAKAEGTGADGAPAPAPAAPPVSGGGR